MNGRVLSFKPSQDGPRAKQSSPIIPPTWVIRPRHLINSDKVFGTHRIPVAASLSLSGHGFDFLEGFRATG